MKKIIQLLVVLSVIGLAFLVSSPALAGPPGTAGGLWQYRPVMLGGSMSGCNTFAQTFEDGLWTGTFDGISTEYGNVTIHCNGAWSFRSIVSFVGSVDGKEGTFEMSVVGSRPDGLADWEGKFVILSGTGELANLRGQGIWWGPGSPGPGLWGDIYYEGNYHFEPGE
jgi:hypothetical protein